jgi:hypothetical protein
MRPKGGDMPRIRYNDDDDDDDDVWGNKPYAEGSGGIILEREREREMQRWTCDVRMPRSCCDDGEWLWLLGYGNCDPCLVYFLKLASYATSSQQQKEREREVIDIRIYSRKQAYYHKKQSENILFV